MGRAGTRRKSMRMMGTSLGDLPRLRDYRRRRISSWDVSGGNFDWWDFDSGQTRRIAEVRGAGCIKHIWMTIKCAEEFYPRKILLRMWWDGENRPSVEVPVGDFFGIGHGVIKNFTSLPLTMSPRRGAAFNSFFPMPFAQGARIELINECEGMCSVWFYVDYEEYDELEQGLGRFHAQWRRENPTESWGEPRLVWTLATSVTEYGRTIWETPNLDGEGNYVILEAEGKGHYVGCHLDVDCFQLEKNPWYGEGDDMIFVDGEPWPPRLHGTGTEDYFCNAFGFPEVFNAPYFGVNLSMYDGVQDAEEGLIGKNSVYRFHIEDPINFEKSIKVTIEHGHANNLSFDYSSTAYWYQTEPHAPFPEMLPVIQRMPRQVMV
jgi:hypothetical protein